MKKYIFNIHRYNFTQTDELKYFIFDKVRNKEYEINNTIFELLNYFKNGNKYDFDKIIQNLKIIIKNSDERESIIAVLTNFTSFLIERNMIIEDVKIKKKKSLNTVDNFHTNNEIGNLKFSYDLNENSRSYIKIYTSNNNKYLLKFYKSKNRKIEEEKAKFEYDVLSVLGSNINIVNVYDYKDFNIITNNNNFIILEYIDGSTIFQKVLNEKLDEKTIKTIINQLINCYSNLHKLNILHGDIHPSNIIYNNESIIKIIDFGESIIIGEKTNKNAGLSFFCPPERLNEISFNKFKHPINKTGEVYQLSLLIYFILNKSIPFDASKWSLLVEQIKNWNYKNFSYEFLSENLNLKINKILEKGLSQDLEYRYKDIVELKKDWLL